MNLLFHVNMRYYLCQVEKGWIVMGIAGCQLNYIWNELQFRIEGLSYDPNLKTGRPRFLTWILEILRYCSYENLTPRQGSTCFQF